jgi:hypothetical protein
MGNENYRPSDKELKEAEEMMWPEEARLSRYRAEGFDAHQEKGFIPIDPRAVAEDSALWEFLNGAYVEVSKRRDGVFIRGDRSKNIDTTQFRRYGIPVPGGLIIPIIDGELKTGRFQSNAEEERDRIKTVAYLPGIEVHTKKEILKRTASMADRVLDPGEAREAADTEKPFRDAARSEHMTREGKEFFDEIAKKRGDKAISDINAQKKNDANGEAE